MPHQPQRQVKHVYANIDTRATTTQLFFDEAGSGNKRIAPEHPATGMIDLTESARGDFFLHGL